MLRDLPDVAFPPEPAWSVRVYREVLYRTLQSLAMAWLVGRLSESPLRDLRTPQNVVISLVRFLAGYLPRWSYRPSLAFEVSLGECGD